jgi:hypothetical protein
LTLSLGDEHENRALRKTFGPKRGEVTGGWKKMHNEEFHDLYSSPSIIRMSKLRMRWVGHAVRMVEKRILLEKPEGERALGRPRY